MKKKKLTRERRRQRYRLCGMRERNPTEMIKISHPEKEKREKDKRRWI